MISLLALVLAYVGASPVQISACSFSDEVVPITSGDVQSEEIAGSQLYLQFVNTAPQIASSVSFSVAVDGKTIGVLDKGSFSQGTIVSHYFPEDRVFSENASCQVTSVVFADGTSWTPPVDGQNSIGF